MVPIGALTTLFQTALGATQLAKGKDIEANRPTYRTYVAPEQFQIERMLRNLAAQPELPGQSRMEDKIGATVSNKINAATDASQSGAEALAAIASMQGNEAGALENLAIAGANNAQNNYANLANQLANIAGIRQAGYEKEFEINKMQPFLDAAQKREAMLDAGTKNLYGGIGEMDDITKKLFFSGEQSPLQVLQGLFSSANQATGDSRATGTGQDLSRLFPSALGGNNAGNGDLQFQNNYDNPGLFFYNNYNNNGLRFR